MTATPQRDGTVAVPAEGYAAPSALSDDPRVVAALEEYLLACENGARPQRSEFLGRHAGVAAEVARCLDGLDFVQGAARELRSGETAPADPTAPPAEPLGDFRILREVGRGGMGVVYEAEQMSLRRQVALKVLPLAATLDPRQLQRFKNETLAAACLHHPHIVPVFAVGCERGVHFYAMQFIEGQSLAAFIHHLKRPPAVPPPDTERTSDFTPPPAVDVGLAGDTPGPAAPLGTQVSVRGAAHCRAAAQLIRQAAEGLEHAHRQGVIHRDIKPANLLLDGQGHLWVADFGLAHMQSDKQLTLTGDLVGTLRYMSPEQALGKRGLVDHRSDIYALGATLYELLTLEPAVGGNDRQEILRCIANEEPAPPRRHNRAVPAELQTIVLKALAREPGERYASAQDLADDLNRFLEDRPILARRPTPAQRLRKWAVRHRAIVTTAAVGLAVALVSTIAVLAAANADITAAKSVADEEREQARAEKKVADDERGKSLAAEKATKEEQQRTAAALKDAKDANAKERRASYGHLVALAWRELEAGNPARALKLLRDAPEEYRHWEWHHLQRLVQPELRAWQPHGGKPAFSLAFSGDGNRLATGGDDGWLHVWDSWTGAKVWSLESKGALRLVALGPDGRTAAYYASQSAPVTTLFLAEEGAAQPLALPGHKGASVRGLAFHPQGRWLASGGSDRTILLWPLPGGGSPRTLTGHTGPVNGLAFSPDGNLLASAAEPDSLRVWEVATGKVLSMLTVKDGKPTSLAWNGSGTALVVGTSAGLVLVWEPLKKAATLSFPAHRTAVTAVAFSPDSQWLVSTAADEVQVSLWHAANGAPKSSLGGHTFPPRQLAFSPAGMLLASVSYDGVRLWDATGLDAGEFPLYGSQPTLNAAGTRLALIHPSTHLGLPAKTTHVVSLWDIETRSVLCTFDRPDEPPRGSSLRLYNTTRFAFRPDRDELVLADQDGTRLVWDVATGRQVASLLVPEDWHLFMTRFKAFKMPVSLQMDPWPEQWFFTLSRDGTRAVVRLAQVAKVRDTLTTAAVFSFKVAPLQFGQRELKELLALSDDGRAVACASWKGGLHVWDVDTGAALLTDYPLPATPIDLKFHPDGRQVAILYQETVVEVVDLKTGRSRLKLEWPALKAHRLTFSPDGKRLVVGTDRKFQHQGGLLVCDADTGQELLTLPVPFPVLYLQFSANGRALLVGGFKKGLRVLEVGPQQKVDRLARLRAWQGAWHRIELSRCQEAGNHEGAFWHLERLTDADLPDREYSLQRALLRADRRAWQAAANDVAKALDRKHPLTNLDKQLFRLAWICLKGGPAGLYPRFCAALPQPAGTDPKGEKGYELVRLYTLGPAAVADFGPVIKLAERSAGLQPDRAAFLYAHGAALYRSGRFAEAVTRLQESLQKQPQWEGHVNTWLLLALAHHALKRPAEARPCYDRAAAEIAKLYQELPADTIVLPKVTTHTYLGLEQLRREADAVFQP